MAATSTQKINSAFKRLVASLPGITFVKATDFRWSPVDRIIYHPDIIGVEDLAQLLHETGHAALGHVNYSSDAELINMELAAWKHACQSGKEYDIHLSIDDDMIQDAMDSYRLWLHNRSVCPRCSAVGIEKSKNLYRCISCTQEWQVNDARACQLRRYKQ